MLKRLGALAVSAVMLTSVFTGVSAASEDNTEVIAEAETDDPDNTIWFDTVPEYASRVKDYLSNKGKAYYGESKSAPIYMIDPNNKGDNCDYNTKTKDPVENDTVCSRIVSRIMSNNALPIGNGRLGGMVYGAIEKEIVQINEDTFYTLQPAANDYVLDYNNMSSEAYISKNGDKYETVYNSAAEDKKAKLPAPKPKNLAEAWNNIKEWSINIDQSDLVVRQAMEEYINCYFLGDPFKQAAFQSFVELYLNFGQTPDRVSDYKRSLDISRAVASVEYDYDDTHYTRENFASYDKQAIVTHLTAEGKNKLNVEAELHTWQHGDIAFEKIADNQIAITGKGKKSDLCFEARLIVDTDGELAVKSILDSPTSSSTSNDETIYTYYPEGSLNTIAITNATYADCYIVGATSYISDENGVRVEKNDKQTPKTRCDAYVNGLGTAPNYNEIKEAHISDYQNYYNRSSVKIAGGTTQRVLPTGERFKNFGSTNDSSLVNLYYNYAKYLMISGSREGSQPLNLQGIWNASNMPAWDSKYTININTEMNYWMAQTANLGEFEKPLLQAILELEDSGETVAREYYGIEDAFVVHHNFDIWRGASIVDKSTTGLWPVGGAWLLNHAWEYYQFNNDAEYLAKFYPIMKKGVKFFDELMVEDPKTGYLISPASVSPEQGGVQPGPAMDHQIIRNLYKITIATNNVLKEAGLIGTEDDAKIAEWQTTLGKICPNLIGDSGSEKGYIKEWVRDGVTESNGKGVSLSHKHTSHLWDVYPGDSVNPFAEKTAEYNAFNKSVDKRCTSDGTGWSIAWRINLCARMNKASAAYTKIKSLFTTGTYPNGFDRHPPFQIDGNFGGASGIQECLIQSYADTVNIIPALPTQWAQGEFNNLKARGNFEISAKWNESKVYDMSVKSLSGGQIKLRTNANKGVTAVKDDLGSNIPFTKESSDTVVTFNTEKGRTYTFDGLSGTAPEPVDNTSWKRTAADIVDFVNVTRKDGSKLPKVENSTASNPGNVGYMLDTRHEEGGSKTVSEPVGFALTECNLTNLKSMSVEVASTYENQASVYVRADNKNGEVIASAKIPNTGGNQMYTNVPLEIYSNLSGEHILYVTVQADAGSEVMKWMCNIKSLSGECGDGMITLAQNNGKIDASVSSAALGERSVAVLVIAAVNDNDTVEEAKFFEVTKDNTAAEYLLPEGSACSLIRAMLIDSTNTIQPLCDMTELVIKH